jgi:hypothetical protein
LETRAICQSILLTLSLTLSSFAHAAAWDASLLKPCVCDQNFDQAIPRVFANRLTSDHEANFLGVESELIDSFTAAKTLANSDKYIFWSVYELGAYDVANSLIRAAHAGVHVQVVTDGKSVKLPSRSDRQYRSYQNRGEMTRDIYGLLTLAGVDVAYSNPEFKPVSTPYPPLMHEKVRIFGIKKGNGVQPTFAYVSTHNDSYSDTIGDPIASLSRERLRKGDLKRSELVPDSFGNVQTAFIVRNSEILKSLYKNYRDQFITYGKGRGHIADLPEQDPLDVKLSDGSTIRVAYTYAKSHSSYNPNQEQADFVESAAARDSNIKIQSARLQQFVFSYAKVANALKDAASADAPKVEVLIDGNFAYQPYSQGRKMAGLFSVQTYRGAKPVDYPWPRALRNSVEVKAYVNGHDKLHTKNTIITYKKASEFRYRIYTGSLNLSSNGVSNKEVMFEFDTSSPSFASVMDEQYKQLQSEGDLKPLAESALFMRLRQTAVSWGGKEIEDTPATVAAYKSFLKDVRPIANKSYDSLNSLAFIGNGIETLAQETLKQDAWTRSLSQFYDNVGAENLSSDIVNDVQKNLNQTKTFSPNVSNVELMMGLTEDKKSLSPAVRNAVLELFQ